MIAGKRLHQEVGRPDITYTYIVNDDQALEKATQVPFDIMHPCHENIKDYVDRGLVQPWDTSLLPSFGELNPYLTQQAAYQGQQYMIPWDWGYASVLYRTDKVDPADATGWELFWNQKYSGKISVWDGSASNLEYTALLLGFPKMDEMNADQLNQAKKQADPAEAPEQVLLEERVRRRWHAARLQVGRHLDHLRLAGRLRDHAGRRPAGGLHAAQPGPAVLVLRLHARQEHQELLPRARVRRVLYQPEGVRADDQPVLLRHVERQGAGRRTSRTRRWPRRSSWATRTPSRPPTCTCRAGSRTGSSTSWHGRRCRPASRRVRRAWQ